MIILTNNGELYYVYASSKCCATFEKRSITHDKRNLATCSQNVAFADYASNNLTSIFIFNQNSSPLMSGGDLVSVDLITWHLDYPHYQSEIR